MTDLQQTILAILSQEMQTLAALEQFTGKEPRDVRIAVDVLHELDYIRMELEDGSYAITGKGLDFLRGPPSRDRSKRHQNSTYRGS